MWFWAYERGAGVVRERVSRWLGEGVRRMSGGEIEGVDDDDG